MNKIYFLFVFTFSWLSAQTQTITFPDTNFKAKLLAADTTNDTAKNLNGLYFKIDANNDGEIQESEAEQVSWLDVEATSISNLTGILYFTNLIYLNCAENQIQALGLDSLINLEELNCDNNQITSLDFTGLSNLQILTCSYNLIEELEFTGINLYHLQCQYNLLTSLNVNSMSALAFLNCDGNQISSFDVNGLENLLELSIIHNQLTSITLNNLPSLEDLAVDENELTSLDISNLSNVSVVNCNINSLTEIICKNGHNESIFFAENPDMNSICADANEITTMQNLATSYGYTCTVNSLCLLSNEDHALDGNFKLYPNPVKNVLNLEANGILTVKSIKVYNILGQMVMTISNPETVSSFSVSDLKTGTYFIQILTDKGTTNSKFIKE